MATKRIFRVTGTEALIKIDGAVGAVTIDLAVDLKLAHEIISGTPTVNIVSMQSSGKTGAVISVARGGANLWDLQANAAQIVNMPEFGGATDATLNTENITVTIAGAEGQLLIKLRKVSGYATTIRPEQNGTEAP